MTLSLAIVTHRYACVVTDRRVSINGNPAEDEYDKTCTLTTRDAKVAVSFSGIARARRFHAHVHLIERLQRCAPPDFALTGLSLRLAGQLSTDFLGIPAINCIPRRLRRFSVMFAGFGYAAGYECVPILSLMSNFEDGHNVSKEAWNRFKFFVGEVSPKNTVKWLATGETAAFAKTKFRALQDAAPNLSEHSVRAQLVKLIQDASKRSKTIGGQCMSIIIRPDPAEGAETDYHVLTPQRTVYFPAAVSAVPPNIGYMRSMYFGEPSLEGRLLAVPIVNRNALCPCGSKKRYKYCHRSRKHHRPILMKWNPAKNHFEIAGPHANRFQGRIKIVGPKPDPEYKPSN